MIIPNSIRSGGHKVEIHLVTPKEIDNIGEYDTIYDLIRLRKNNEIPRSIIEEGLLHEILELIKFRNNLEINHTHLTVLSECLYAIIVNNKLNFNEEETE